MRHAFVTVALDAGVPLHRVQDAAGHASADTTRRYDRNRHALDGHAVYALEQAVEQLA
jgi:integrase